MDVVEIGHRLSLLDCITGFRKWRIKFHSVAYTLVN
jgi:hypothetical protein